MIRGARRGAWRAAAWALAAIVAAPVAAVVANLLVPRFEVWRHLAQTILGELTANTAWLLAGVAVLTTGLGTALAWLVVAHRFPGRRVFEWTLVLPLAMPAYVAGFVYLALFEFGGPVDRWLQALTAGAVRVPDVRTGWGAVAVLSLVLYPYPYLLARSAFASLGASAIEAGRSLGASSRRVFWSVAFPLARPAIGTGVTLALMEALADFGTVALFDFRTYTVGIYRVWFGMFDRAAAGQLAVALLVWALGLLLLERALRRRRRYVQAHGRHVSDVWPRLSRPAAWLATAACATVVTLAFLVPVGTLGWWSVTTVTARARPYPPLVSSSLLLATVAAVTCVAAGLALAYGRRLVPDRGLRLATDVAGLGYALPGSVVAVGVLVVATGVDDVFARVVAATTSLELPPLLAGTGLALLFAYTVRFMALALHPLDAGLGRIKPSLDESAASLGASPIGIVRRVHIPLLRGPLAAAALLVFVDVMKELPATMLIRPLGWDTLAVEVWQLTTESLWHEAALPALTIVAAGLPAAIYLVRASSREHVEDELAR